MKRALVASLVLLGAVASGCGDDGTSDGSGTDDATSQAPAGDSSTDGDSDGGGDGNTAGALPKFCDLLTPEQVAGAVGAPVTLTTGPFDACEFDQEDPRALSGSLGAVEVDTGNGGFEGYRNGTTGTLEKSESHDVEGVGEEAFVVTGNFPGGSNVQAAAGALVGGTVLTVNLAQGTGMGEDKLVAIAEKLLKLLVDAG